MSGIFICFEGIQASGKTTQIELLMQRLQQRGRSVFVSKAYTEASRSAIEDFLGQLNVAKDSRAAVFAFQALHAAQAGQVTRALEQHDYVIADRWDGTAITFLELNNHKYGFSRSFISNLVGAAFTRVQPDITYFLDVPPQMAFARYSAREQVAPRHEARVAQHFERTSLYFNTLAAVKAWHRLDGKESVQQIAAEIDATLPSLSQRPQQRANRVRRELP